MKNTVILCLASFTLGPLALAQDMPSAPEHAPLLLVQEISLPQVEGRIDHFTFDAKRKRVIGAALGKQVGDDALRLHFHSQPASGNRHEQATAAFHLAGQQSASRGCSF
jgi:hypothetical protein